MKKAFVQLFTGIGVVILILWVIVYFGRSVVRGDTVAHHATPPADRQEVGADTGDIHVVAYSMAEGDAYVKIDGDTIYAEARLRGPISASTPTATPLPPAADYQPTSTPTATPTPKVVTLTFTSAANIRSAPWGNILGSAQPGETYNITGVANPWYQFDWKGQTAWVRGDLVFVNGDTSTLPLIPISVAEPVAVADPTATPIPPVEAVEIPEAPSYQFFGSYPNFFPEANYPAFYVQVMQNGNPAPGRWCVVFKDDKEIGRAQSINVLDETNKGTPWEDDNYAFNCEVKFHEHNEQSWPGLWRIELWDGAGSVLGASESFTMQQDKQQVWLSFSKFD